MPFPAQLVNIPTGFGGQTLPDWISALSRLQEGRISDPSQDKLYDSPRQPWQQGIDEEGRALGRNKGGLLGMRPQWVPDAPSGTAEALPIGDMGDPVSLLAQVLSPLITQGILRYTGGALSRKLENSVVRDVNDKLLKLYHGTGKSFDKFDVTKASPEGLYGPGIYTTDAPNVASGYAGRDPGSFLPFQVGFNATPNVRSLYSSMKNPFDIEMPEVPLPILQRIDAVLKKEKLPLLSYGGQISGSAAYDILAYELGHVKANEILAKAGFDGITHIGGRATVPHRVFMAFNPKTLHNAIEVEGAVPYAAPASLRYAIAPAILEAIRQLNEKN